MKEIEFLSPKQIQDIPVQEAQEYKEAKRTTEKIEAIYSSGANNVV